METTRPAISKEQEAELWSQAQKNMDCSARLTLIDHYTYVARNIAARYYRNRFDEQVEFGDYLQYAMIGLIESIDRYDPENEASFSTFAGYRVKGAVLNGLDKLTEKREQYAFRKRYQRERLESVAGNAKKCADTDVFAEMVDVAIELAFSYMLEDSGLVASQGVQNNDEVYKGRLSADINTQLQSIVSNLPDREKFIIQNHYFHGVGFEALGNLLGVTKGRVSQLHKRALQLVKNEFDNSYGIDAFY